MLQVAPEERLPSTKRKDSRRPRRWLTGRSGSSTQPTSTRRPAWATSLPPHGSAAPYRSPTIRRSLPAPRRTARHGDAVRLLPPSWMPKLGKGGSAHSLLAMLHSLAHTESWSVDLAWDIVARFVAQLHMPREFFDDFTRVAQDEGWHFVVLSAWLRDLGSHYGTLIAHDGLWDSAMSMSHCLFTRLAVEHCIHEQNVGIATIAVVLNVRKKSPELESLYRWHWYCPPPSYSVRVSPHPASLRGWLRSSCQI